MSATKVKVDKEPELKREPEKGHLLFKKARTVRLREKIYRDQMKVILKDVEKIEGEKDVHRLTFLTYRLVKSFFFTLNWINPPTVLNDGKMTLIPFNYTDEVKKLFKEKHAKALLDSFETATLKSRLSEVEKYFMTEFPAESFVDKATFDKVKEYVEGHEKELILDPLADSQLKLKDEIKVHKEERAKKFAEDKKSKPADSSKSPPKPPARKKSSKKAHKQEVKSEESYTSDVEDDFQKLMEQIKKRAMDVKFKRGDFKLYTELLNQYDSLVISTTGSIFKVKKQLQTKYAAANREDDSSSKSSTPKP